MQITTRNKMDGFSLVELLVGLVIGLLATLAIMQVFSAFDGQKRSTSGSSDAQTNGSLGLYSLKRDVQLAGYALPLNGSENTALRCSIAPLFDHDDNVGTPGISMWPLDIVDGGNAAGASDTVIVRYGDSASGGIPIKISGTSGGNTLLVPTNMSCNNNDVIFVVTGNSCNVTRANDTALNSPIPRSDNTHITVVNAVGISSATAISCLGAWNEQIYQVVNGNLTRNGTPIVAGVVNIQAQYGISGTPADNRITQWVDATGAWLAPGNTSAACSSTAGNRNCIKAIRVAVIARNGLLEKTAISQPCSSTTAANPTGICAWDATSANPVNPSPAPAVNLTNTASWTNYRYRVYESIIPLRNIVWTKDKLL